MNDFSDGFAAYDVAARHNLVADLLLYGVRFAGYLRFVNFNRTVDEHGIGTNLTACVKADQFVPYDVCQVYFTFLAVSYSGNFRGGNKRKFVYCLFGFQLLNKSD